MSGRDEKSVPRLLCDGQGQASGARLLPPYEPQLRSATARRYGGTILAANLKRLIDTVPDDAVVLDIGGWGKPLTRADWVIDVMPYASRGLYGRDGPDPERFSDATWIQRDICDRTPYPFADKSVDFVVCSHTLEDVRDPLWVCAEMNRIARSGYIEVPSRREEQCLGVQGPWAGWGHHRWLVDIIGNRIEFTFKHHVVHSRPGTHFQPDFLHTLLPEERVESLWWTGGFEYRERMFIGPGELNQYLSDYVAHHAAKPRVTLPTRRLIGRLGRLAGLRSGRRAP